MSWQRWVFRFLDTCFFRDAAPFHAGEGGYTRVKSMFSLLTTIQGAIRTSLAWNNNGVRKTVNAERIGWSR